MNTVLNKTRNLVLKIANSKNLNKLFLDESRNDDGFLNFVTDYQCDDLQMEFDKSESETLKILNEIENKIRNNESVDDELVLLTINLQRLSDYFSYLRSDVIKIIGVGKTVDVLKNIQNQ